MSVKNATTFQISKNVDTFLSDEALMLAFPLRQTC